MDTNEIAVIVGRFQVPELTEGHKNIFRSPYSSDCIKLKVFIGTADVNPTNKNPLDYESREIMVEQYLNSLINAPLTTEYSRVDFSVQAIEDCTSDTKWVESLLLKISEDSNYTAETLLSFYGGRDSFLHQTQDIIEKLSNNPTKFVELHEVSEISGTKVRSEVSCLGSKDFRSGVIYSQEKRFPCIYPVVEAIVFDKQNQKVLMGRKSGDEEGLFRFIGGFVDTSDSTLEDAVLRELKEETYSGIANYVEMPVYVDSHIMDSRRLRGSKDKMLSVVYMIPVSKDQGHNIKLQSGDDLCEVQWISLKDVVLNDGPKVLPGHKDIAKIFSHFLMDKNI